MLLSTLSGLIDTFSLCPNFYLSCSFNNSNGAFITTVAEFMHIAATFSFLKEMLIG